MQTLKKTWRSNEGSTLVGAVVICAILAVAGAGLMGASRNTVAGEAQSFDDARAYYTAEAGLLAATSWLQNSVGNQLAVMNAGTRVFNDIRPANAAGLVYDAFICNVTLTANNFNNTITVRSQAIENLDANMPSMLPYTKELSWVLTNINRPPTLPAGAFGYFVNDLSATGGWAGLEHQVFTGPFHSNTPIHIANPGNNPGTGSSPLFRGNVTIYEDLTGRFSVDNYYVPNFEARREGRRWGWATPGALRADPGGNNYENNYSRGVTSGVNSNTGELDVVFEGEFNPFAPRYGTAFNDNVVNADVRWLDNAIGTPTTGNDVNLIFGVDGTGPFFEFNGVRNAPNGVPYDPTIPLILNSNVQVTVGSGIVRGQITVTTHNNQDIRFNVASGINPGAGLLYENVNVNNMQTQTNNQLAGNAVDTNLNFGIPLNNPNILGFYSDKNVEFIEISGTGVNWYVTAQIFASEANNGTFRRRGGNNVNKDTHVRIIGAAVMNDWWTFDRGNDFRFYSFYDRRVNDDGEAIGAPGINFIQVDNDGNPINPGGSQPHPIIATNWIERNF